MVKKMLCRARAGFSLTEAMMVIAVLGIMFTLGPTILTQVLRFYYLHIAKIEIQRDARSSLDVINRFLRQAQADTVVVDQAAGQPPYSRITFELIGGQSMQFYQQGQNLFQVGQSTTTISKNLRFINFAYPRSDDPTIISVAMTMEKTTYQGGTKALELSVEKVRIMN
jgi:prepilin-type N-terminal cleavage/methylation domain-containing protein